MKVLKIFICTALLAISTLFIGGGAYYFTVTNGVSLVEEKLVLPEKTTAVYDALGEPVNFANVVSRDVAKIDSLNEKTIFAFVDTEDKRFFSHSGFDFKRIVKAAINNVRAGGFKEGASTISQQLVKNTHLTQEKTFKRKLQEFKLTRQLERRYSKRDILEKYLNSIYFGHSCFGIEAAAQFYFGKPASKLTLGESAILAGLVKSPNNFSPFKNVEKCKNRQATVLRIMQENGHADKTEAENAKKEPLPIEPFVKRNDMGYLRYVFDEMESLAEKYAFTVGGNVEIYTYLDPDLQKEADSLIEERKDVGGTAIVLDVKTNAFKACASTVGNVKRSPGSVIKPLLVYAPAVEENLLCPATPILDEKTDFNGYNPENYGGEHLGYVSARTALSKSLNVPAVKTLNALGVDKATNYLEKMQLTVDETDKNLALALGGMKDGFTLKELVNAYSVFPNGGNYSQAGFIKEIKINGATAYKKQTKKRRVFGADTAYLLSDIMKTTAKTGTAKKLRELPFDVGAKTGTAGSKTKTTDAYTLSFTTRDVVGVWFGNADCSALSFTGGGEPCNVSLKLHKFISCQRDDKAERIENFSPPKSVTEVELDKIEYSTTRNIVLADDHAPKQFVFKELFKKSYLPQKKSDKFSNPTISSPTITVNGKDVSITFPVDAPTFYQYTVYRYDYDTHTTVYSGDLKKIVTDKNLTENKTYIYTVIPSFEAHKGKEIVLPKIRLGAGESLSPSPPPTITEKPWWEY